MVIDRTVALLERSSKAQRRLALLHDCADASSQVFGIPYQISHVWIALDWVEALAVAAWNQILNDDVVRSEGLSAVPAIVGHCMRTWGHGFGAGCWYLQELSTL